MKVRFAIDILQDSNAWDVLDIVVQHFFDRRHVWDIIDPNEIENSPWIQTDSSGRAGRRNLSALKKCYTDSAYPRNIKMHKLTIVITNGCSSDSSDFHLNPSDARRCLDGPAWILVENAESDGAFLEAMICAFQRRDLLDAHTEGWFTIRHLGGFGEVEKHINQIKASTSGPLRAFVLVDSDRLHPTHVSSTMQKVQRACTPHNVLHKILNKRKIENYLPVNVIQKVQGRNRETAKAFLCLSQEQKDFYEMKGGFKKDQNGRVIIPDEQKPLFQHTPKKTLNKLCGGFGPNIWECFKACRTEITQEAVKLCCTGEPEEIERMLDSIETLL